MNDELYCNFRESLEQKYNAICFDIDGTLTEKESKKIDKRAVQMIIEILRKKIPVVFITGRGESGINDLKQDIYNGIINQLSISEIKRIYVLANDGARLFYSDASSYEEFLSRNIYISTDDELEQLKEIDRIAKDIRSNYFDIAYSKDLLTNKIINVRLILKTEDTSIIEKTYKMVSDIIYSAKFKNIYLTRGIYQKKSVIQIGTSTKNNAIERVEKIIGVPKDSMMRVGDCGDVYGNDYLMLNCRQGYSVDKTSGLTGKCFPVFDKNGNILKGVNATLELVNNAKLLPTVCLESADKTNYKTGFAIAERSIVLGRKKLLNNYNELININFEENDGIDGLFDKSSGSIIIPMYEWELISSNPLKSFWGIKEDGHFKYLMRDDNNYLLRGSSTYYYYLANRKNVFGKDTTSKSDVLNWYNNYIMFFDNAKRAILKTEDINYIINKKMLLGILDNCRNVLLILMNHQLISNNFDKNVLVNISSKNNKCFFEVYKTLIKIENIMSNLCFKTAFLVDRDYISDVVNKTMKIMNNSFIIERISEEKVDYSKDYRAYREIDNFGENYTAVSLYREKRDNDDKAINACGLSYGGIELPIIAKIVDKNMIENLLLLKFSKEVSGYSNKQLMDLRKFNINNYGGLIKIDFFQNTSVDLFDDNVLTGKTLQLAINSLYDCDIDVGNICIVRYPGINRIDQMFLDNTAAVDFHLFFNYIYGLCYSSPYSWKDNEWKKSNGKVDYKDSMGVFDLNRKKIIECIIKNHDYKEESEIGEYKRRLIK